MGSPEKFTPKYCTNISFSVTNKDDVIITLSYMEQNNAPILIERVFIDLPHAKEVSKILNELLIRVEKGEKGNVPEDK